MIELRTCSLIVGFVSKKITSTELGVELQASSTVIDPIKIYTFRPPSHARGTPMDREPVSNDSTP